MQYKTIVLELIQDQYPQMHEQLRARRMLLTTVNHQAAALKRYHETWVERLSLKRPESDPLLIASRALELAIEDLREENSRYASLLSDAAAEPLSLDQAMAPVHRHSRPV
jgi:hypothetical protein